MSNKNQDLKKSIDALIDELFVEEKVEKGMDFSGDVSTSYENDDSNPGRPKQISSIPQSGDDGKRAGDYDQDVTMQNEPKSFGEQGYGSQAKKQVSISKSEEEKKEEDKEEMKKAEGEEGEKKEDMEKAESEDEKKKEGMEKAEGEESEKKDEDKEKMEKSGSLMGVSKAEYAEFQAFKAQQAELKKSESLKKAQSEQNDLIKSVVAQAVDAFKKENDELKKAIVEQNERIKAMANRPKAPVAISSLNAIEKSMGTQSKAPSYSKDDLLDVAEKLVKSGDLKPAHLIELENSGFIYNAEYRSKLEKAMK